VRGDSCNLVRGGRQPGDAAPRWIKHAASFPGGIGCATTNGIRHIPHCQKTSRLSVRWPVSTNELENRRRRRHRDCPLIPQVGAPPERESVEGREMEQAVRNEDHTAALQDLWDGTDHFSGQARTSRGRRRALRLDLVVKALRQIRDRPSTRELLDAKCCLRDDQRERRRLGKQVLNDQLVCS